MHFRKKSSNTKLNDQSSFDQNPSFHTHTITNLKDLTKKSTQRIFFKIFPV